MLTILSIIHGAKFYFHSGGQAYQLLSTLYTSFDKSRLAWLHKFHELPYKPLRPRLMIPMKWPIQKHCHSEDIYKYIKRPNEKQFCTVVDL